MSAALTYRALGGIPAAAPGGELAAPALIRPEEDLFR